MLRETLEDFKKLYSEDPTLAASLAGDRYKDDPKQQAHLAAWTMLTHSLLNTELVKVRR